MPDFVPGLNDPSPVSRVFAFGYYDGATDGVLQLGDGGPVYRFDWAEEPTPGREREYTLRPLPAGSFERLAAIVGEHIEPHWPAWVPIWKFPSEEVQRDVERRVDAVLDQAGEPKWQITTSDTVSFGAVAAEPARSTVRAK
jgi:hypothetical protein